MSERPEILFLCSRMPFPPNKGDKIRSHAILTHLAQRYRVHLACFAETAVELAGIDKAQEIAGGECLILPVPPLNRYWRMVRALLNGQPITSSVFSSAALENWLSSLCRRRRLEGIVLFGSAMAPLVLGTNAIDPAKVLFDMVDIDSDKWRQLAEHVRGPARRIYRREADVLLALERTAVAKFGATVLASPYECASFAKLAPDSAAKLKPLVNGVDSTYFAPGSFANPFPPGQIALVMTGHMDYWPNTDAAIWFGESVLPRIRAKIPEACFYAIGARPPRALRRRASEGFVVTGFVDDVRPYLAHAHAAVAPLRLARGVQNKVLEAMAMQKAVVATWEATRALTAKPGVELLVANDAETFAEAVVQAIRGGERDDLAAAARRYACSQHDWPTLMGKFDGLFAAVASEPSGMLEFVRPSGSTGVAARPTLAAGRWNA